MIIIADIGSCHMGKLAYAKEAIDVAKDAGVDIIKFQLFRYAEDWTGTFTGVLRGPEGNVQFPRKYWMEVVEYANRQNIDLFASVFDLDAVDLVHKSGIKKIKLAYSQNFNLKFIKRAKELGLEIWASGDEENYPYYADKRLFCIPEYPVKRGVGNITGDVQIFDGLSSHWFGFAEDIKIFGKMKDWKYLEKHMTLDHDDIDCPDHWLALSPSELKQMVKELKEKCLKQ